MRAAASFRRVINAVVIALNLPVGLVPREHARGIANGVLMGSRVPLRERARDVSERRGNGRARLGRIGASVAAESPAAALGVDDGVNGPTPGGPKTPELHPAQIDPYEPRPGGGDGVQRGIADVDIGTKGPWPGWCWWLGSLWP